MFKGREGPEGYEFPACRPCNNGTGQLEQVVALTFALGENNTRNHDRVLLSRLIEGVKNNTPHLLPDINLSANQKRKLMAEFGLRPLHGETYADQPLALVHPKVRDMQDQFARKLTCALYYKHAGSILPAEQRILTACFPMFQGQAEIENFLTLFPALELTGRSNVNIGEQFAYKWGRSADGELFGFLAQFGSSHCVFGAATGHDAHTSEQPWIPHLKDLPPAI